MEKMTVELLTIAIIVAAGKNKKYDFIESIKKSKLQHYFCFESKERIVEKLVFFGTWKNIIENDEEFVKGLLSEDKRSKLINASEAEIVEAIREAVRE
jgi:DNA-directed RNA polymerase beta' subunit